MTTSELAGPRKDGLWRITLAGAVCLERVYCSDHGGSAAPEMTHAAIAGLEFAVCGRSVRFRFGPHPTDTVSQIECKQCVRWIDRYTQ